MKFQFLEAGEVVTTHGVRGEMKVLPWADGPDFLTEFNRVRIGGAEYKVESCRIQKTCNLLKVQGIDTMEAAQSMRGKTVEVYRSDAPEDMIFVAELIGFSVFADGKEIGKIAAAGGDIAAAKDELRKVGFSEAEVKMIGHENMLRLL